VLSQVRVITKFSHSILLEHMFPKIV